VLTSNPRAAALRVDRLASHHPFDEGRLLASLIPNAQLIPLETRNHILLPIDPAFTVFFAALREFLAGVEPT